MYWLGGFAVAEAEPENVFELVFVDVLDGGGGSGVSEAASV